MKSRKQNNKIAQIIKDIRIHFNRYEAPYYGVEIDPNTGKCYILEAKRKFTKYYLEHLGEFYENVVFHDNVFV